MINYLLACWSGHRRTPHLPYQQDAGYYLRNHIRYLHEVPHDLARISVAVPHNPKEPAAFRRVVESMPRKIQNAEVVVVRRPNVGLSYGSWSQMIGETLGQFDYYIINEDDYYYPLPHFDRVMESLIRPEVGFLCGCLWRNPLHASVFGGLVRSKALEDVWKKFGELPHHKSADYKDAERIGQIGGSNAFFKSGWEVTDWRDHYATAFRFTNPMRTEKFGRGPVLLRPIGDDEEGFAESTTPEPPKPEPKVYRPEPPKAQPAQRRWLPRGSRRIAEAKKPYRRG